MSLKAFLILGDFRLQLPHPVYNLGKWVLSRDLLLLLFFLLSINDPHALDIQLLLLLPLRSSPLNQFLYRETNFMENFEASI